MQFGRIENGAYTLDFRSPFTAVQAFAIALASITQRLKWCEVKGIFGCPIFFKMILWVISFLNIWASNEERDKIRQWNHLFA